MLARLFANLIKADRFDYARCPNSLKPQVNKFLEDEGYGHLIK